MGKTVLVCSCCYAIVEDYHIANDYNSTKFSRCCQAACDKYEECDANYIDYLKMQHQEYMRRSKNNS